MGTERFHALLFSSTLLSFLSPSTPLAELAWQVNRMRSSAAGIPSTAANAIRRAYELSKTSPES